MQVEKLQAQAVTQDATTTSLRLRLGISQQEASAERKRNGDSAFMTAEKKAAAAGRPQLLTRLVQALNSGSLDPRSFFVLYLWDCGRYWLLG